MAHYDVHQAILLRLYHHHSTHLVVLLDGAVKVALQVVGVAQRRVRPRLPRPQPQRPLVALDRLGVEALLAQRVPQVDQGRLPACAGGPEEGVRQRQQQRQ